jgi:hypothetical protein
MTIYELKDTRIEALMETTFQEQGLRERQDLQRLLQDQIQVVDPDVMILAEEFGHWDDSKRRIDLLGIDRDARLVVIELKRTEDGGHMELQALRYASMVSQMTFEQAVEAHSKWLTAKGGEQDGERAILEFLGWQEADEERFGQDVRIVLVSGDFSKELTTSVLWLNERDMDVRCVRMKPYVSEGRILLDVQQVIPLPEAGDYEVRVREKERKERQARTFSRDYTRFDIEIDGELHQWQAKRGTVHMIVSALCLKGVSPDEISEASSLKGSRLWRSADGELSAEEFEDCMELAAKSGGPVWDHSRWSCEEDTLIITGGKTWALSNQWGKETAGALRGLMERWPDLGIKLTEFAS